MYTVKTMQCYFTFQFMSSDTYLNTTVPEKRKVLFFYCSVYYLFGSYVYNYYFLFLLTVYLTSVIVSII